MKKILETLKKFFLLFYLLLIHALAIFFVTEKYVKPFLDASQTEVVEVDEPTRETPVPTPQSVPSIEPTIAASPEVNANQTQNVVTNQNEDKFAPDSPSALMIPVVGIKREQLRDTFNDARSAGRVHNAIDIMAAGGTPVVAVADGEIAKFFDSERGGITIYQYSDDRRHVYYYAHLQKRADNLKEKDFVKRGAVLGYVGDSGNSGAGNYHLHFTVTVLAQGQSFWQGTDVNPYPLLKDAIEAR